MSCFDASEGPLLAFKIQTSDDPLNVTTGSQAMTTTLQPIDDDLPLRRDIRLLGRILGDTVREQQGDAVFSIVERIRQLAIQFRRDQDPAARKELEAVLNNLSRERTVEISTLR